MAVLQELTKKDLAGLVAGAAAVNAIVGRISKEEPDELPTDQIRQWEIAALYHLEVAKDAMALGFKRRLENGATVQPGRFTLEQHTDTMEDLEDSQREYSGGRFNCVGFDGVSYDPTGTARDTSLDWLLPERTSKKAAKQGGRKATKYGGRK